LHGDLRDVWAVVTWGAAIGLACIAGVAAVVVAFPALLRYDAEEAIAAVAEREAEPVPA
jgi:hypothetical protein